MRKRLVPLVGSLLFALGCSGGAGGSGGGGGPGDTLAWSTIPPLLFSVGVPVSVNMRQYLTDPGGAAAITLDLALPGGLQLDDGVILGTPTADAPSRDYAATADSGVPGAAPATSAPFSIEVIAAAGGIAFEVPTPHQIGIYLRLAGSVPMEATATVRYRATTEAAWRTGHPLVRIVPAWTTDGAPVPPVDAFAGTIFDLLPGTSYDVEVTLTTPADGTQTMRTVFSTRALPGPSGPATVRATPASNLQALFDALSPGDVLELANGTYDVTGLHLDVSGTPEAPITIRGESRDGVVVRRSTDSVLHVWHASHVILEDLTIEGSGVDGATGPKSAGIDFWDGARQEFVTLRRLTIRGVDLGIVAWDTVNSILVYKCRLSGNNLWNAEFVESSKTWDDDGIRVPGEGNCVFDSTLHGFGDSLAVKGGVFSAAVYFYRNRITMSGDDACEGDYSTRNIGFYDNHVSNTSTLLSLDPVWGGPFYCFRNIAVNTVRGPFKLNNEQSGFLIYNNTIIRTEGTTGCGWVQFQNGALRNWSYRNNIIIYHGTGGLSLALESNGNDPIDFTHNGWYPDGDVWWTHSGGSYSSFAEAWADLNETEPVFGTSRRRHDNDLVIEREPFVATIPLGADHLFEVMALFVPVLDAGSAARNAGTEIPNITDGYSGAAPDMGAIISGRAMPNWGTPP